LAENSSIILIEPDLRKIGVICQGKAQSFVRIETLFSAEFRRCRSGQNV
jgi:hypothetical protein